MKSTVAAMAASAHSLGLADQVCFNCSKRLCYFLEYGNHRMLTNILKTSVDSIRRPLRERRLNRLISKGLPNLVVPSIRFLIGAPVDNDTDALVAKVENIRKNIAKRSDSGADIFYSPEPGSSGSTVSIELRPTHGEILEFSMDKIATTGKNKKWGTALHLLSRTTHAEQILELGSCAGISACYLSTSPYCKKMITVEGSRKLAEIARETTTQLNSKVEVLNTLFDDALDKLGDVPHGEVKFDLVFIDGHHEKIATLHYWERIKKLLNEGATVIFDDISWSVDMRDAWKILSHQQGFTHTIDLGVIGVCTWRGDETIPLRWNLQPVIGNHHIGKPRGWKKS